CRHAADECFLQCYGDHRHLHSFPTRRSSDLGLLEDSGTGKDRKIKLSDLARRIIRDKREGSAERVKAIREAALSPSIYAKLWERSEEHTSELQSRENLVCRLLLEKKNKKNK